MDSRQYEFMMGYLSWRWGDFLYYQAKYGQGMENNKVRNKLAKDIVARYEKAGRYLFQIRDMTCIKEAAANQIENQRFLAYLANDVVAAYIDIMETEELSDLSKVLKIGENALAFSNDLPSGVKGFILRNLGVAYERYGDMDQAFEKYKQAYQLKPSSHLAAHYIGAFYIKRIKRQIETDLSYKNGSIKDLFAIDERILKKLSPESRKIILDWTKRSIYWYQTKQINNNGQAEEILPKLYTFYYYLEHNEECKKDIQKTQECLEFNKFHESPEETPIPGETLARRRHLTRRR